MELRVIVLFLTLALATGCSSKIKINSEPPEVTVHFIKGEVKEKKSLGKTPLEMPVAEFEEKVGPRDETSQFYTVEFTKEGFETQVLTIPYASSGTLLTELNIKLKKGDDKKQELTKAQELINQLFLAQKFAITKQFERALIELDKIIEKHPDFSRALSMKGSIYLAQKNYPESLKFYEQALKADPQLEETVKLAAKVRQLISGRKPAGRR